MVQTVFWSGGFDSTYIVLDCLRKGIDVQPIYSLSREAYAVKELQAIGKMQKKVVEHPNLTGKLLPLNVHGRLDKYTELTLDSNDEYISAFNALFLHKNMENNDFLIRIRGRQPLHLALLLEQYPNTLYGLVSSGGKLRSLFEKQVNFHMDENKVVSFSYTDDCDKNFYKIYGKGIYPLLYMSNRTMMNHIIEWGCKDFLDAITFCYDDVLGCNCGMCRPCEFKIGFGMYEFFDVKAIKHYEICEILKKKKSQFLGVPLQEVFAEYVKQKFMYDTKYKNNPTKPKFECLIHNQVVPIGLIKEFNRLLHNTKVNPALYKGVKGK